MGLACTVGSIRGSGECVQDVPLGLPPEESLVLVLPVEIDQALPELPDKARRGRRTVDPGTIASLSEDLAAQYQPISFDLNALLLAHADQLWCS